jgi:hypothetical protein
VIRADDDVLRLKTVESRLEAAEEDLKKQKHLLDSARKTTSKHEDSFNMMISSAVWPMLRRCSRIIFLI